MKAQDIKVGHIYYVDFEPTRKGEFDKNHMALVLKKTVNEITFIVIPLTSNQSGLGINKVELEITSQLPKNLQSKKTYAVYDQIRTVNASRFHPLLENGTLCEVKVSSEELDIIVTAIIQNLLQGMPTEQVTSILKACSSIEK